MFSPNIILGIIALVGLVLVHRGGGSSRGGEFPDLLRLVRRRPREDAVPATGVIT